MIEVPVAEGDEQSVRDVQRECRPKMKRLGVGCTFGCEHLLSDDI